MLRSPFRAAEARAVHIITHGWRAHGRLGNGGTKGSAPTRTGVEEIAERKKSRTVISAVLAPALALSGRVELFGKEKRKSGMQRPSRTSRP